MEVQIPSPSVFLRKSPVLKPIQDLPLKKPVKPRNNASSKTAAKTVIGSSGVQVGAITKPKQSKSRNGCVTCKKKRLKCDEIKPSCAQCAKRNVPCEGYKKDYKWRSFEETSFNPKSTTKTKKPARSFSFNPDEGQPRPVTQNGPFDHPNDDPEPTPWSPAINSALASAVFAFQGAGSPKSLEKLGSNSPYLTPSAFSLSFGASDGDFPDGLDPYSLPNTARTSNHDDGSGRSSGSTLSSGSPRLADICLPNTDFHRPPDPSEMRPPMSPLPYQPNNVPDSPGFEATMAVGEEFDEEILRQPTSPNSLHGLEDASKWNFRPGSPSPSENSSTSSKSSNMTLIARQPRFDPASPEMLIARFDQETCGILSIKDGPTENPWRTLIWPLARESPALYFAMNALTAFHGASQVPHLHIAAMQHMNKSIKKLAAEIGAMQIDSALATSLALAFSEGWDRHVSTGIQHLKGARILVNNAVVKQRREMQLGILSDHEAMRLKFLCNTFVYMDVIARLTSLEQANDLNLEEVLLTVNQPMGDLIEIDPLMGCATTLFPLIGRVADLIQRVRKIETNSLAIVSEAMELKEQLQQWPVPNPSSFDEPEDVTSEVQHSIQTAEAYRYATMLYLHQAIPEIPSEPSDTLARRALQRIATVPLSSRAIIVQIFPLLAAGCEVTTQDDRTFVLQRWAAMCLRLKIGNVDSCVSVVREVWNRRDRHEAEKQERLMRRYAARGVPNGDLVSPMLHPGKRRAQNTESSTEEGLFGGYNDGVDHDIRPMKRRVTFDAMAMPMPMMGAMPLPSPGLPRRIGDVAADQLDHEYTVRGKLHWLGVMEDRHWEGKSLQLHVAVGIDY